MLSVCCVVCNCVLVGYTAEPPNVIGHIQQTLLEWGLLSPPNGITALSHLFSPSCSWSEVSTDAFASQGGVHHSAAALRRAAAAVRRGRTRPDNWVCLCFVRMQIWEGTSLPTTRRGEKNSTLAKQDLRTEKVWSFISHQIQIRILIQPLNPVYPFNPRLGVCIRMWAREKGGEGLQIQPRTG